MTDKENQLDEICVIQSIYTEEEFSCEHNELIKGHFAAYINLPQGFFITYKNFKENKMINVPISHLPPIILKFILPSDYPSNSMPNFEISCIWLSIKKLNLLCKRLDELWKEYSSTVILYIWTQFLKEESLEYLGVGQSIDLTRRYLTELRRFGTRNHMRHQNDELDNSKEHDLMNKKIQSSGNHETKVTSINNEEQGKSLQSRLMGESQENVSLNKSSSCYDVPRSLTRMNPERTSTPLIKDPRIVFQSLTAIYTHQYIAAYNEDRTQIQFLKNIYLCEICFKDKVGANCIKFLPCNHVYCKECVREYFEIRIKDGMVQSMPCPYDKCKTEASQNQIKEIIGSTLYDKYDQLLLSATLNMMDDITYCPRITCNTPVMRDADDKMAVCTSCRYVFCVFCKMTYHGVEPCRIKAEEKRKLVEEYEQGDNDVKFKLEKRYGKKHLQNMVQTYKSENWISTNSKQCPRCGANIEKSNGCNKMVCWKCKEYFCWLCLSSLDPNAPYQHYMNPSSKCNNQLFQGVIVDEEIEEEPFENLLDELDAELNFLGFYDGEEEGEFLNDDDFEHIIQRYLIL